jgi:hypothetical protein
VARILKATKSEEPLMKRLIITLILVVARHGRVVEMDMIAIK